MLSGVMANVLDWDMIESKSELLSRDYVKFRINTFMKSIDSLILPAMG